MKAYKYKINGKDYEVVISGLNGNIADVTVNGTPYKVEMEDAPAQAVPAAAPVAAAAPAAAPAPAPAPAAKPAGAGKAVISPLPGVIVEVSVKEGQSVNAGDKVAVIEAMKMENDIVADTAGTVTAIHISKGDSVLEGAKIVTIA